jgi:hypothetical protein
VPSGDGAEAIQVSRHGPEPEGGYSSRAGFLSAATVMLRRMKPTASQGRDDRLQGEDHPGLDGGGPGGRVVGRGRSFGAVTGLVVVDVVVAGQAR